MTQALTRALKLESKQKWNNGLGLVTYEFKALEAWVVEEPTKKQEDLTKHLRQDQTESEVRWHTEEQIEIMKGIQKSWDNKLQYISKILSGLQDEVANAPAPVSPDDEDTYQSRSFNLRAQEKVLEEAQQVFVRWKMNFLRSIKIYKDAIASGKETTEPKPATGGTGSGHHSPTRTKNPKPYTLTS